MDEKDRHIIRVLQRDGRISNQDLATAVNLSPSPCLRRVRNLEKAKVIRGYGARVDARAYGFGVSAFVSIKLERHDEETIAGFEAEIMRIDEVLDCYMMTGQSDYELYVVVKSLEHYERFVRTRLHRIEGVASIETRFAYGTVKEASAFPVL